MIQEVKSYIQGKEFKDVWELFQPFKGDIEKVIIAAILLDLDYNDLVPQIKSRNLTNNEIFERASEYLNYPLIFDTLIPKSVRTASVLFYSTLGADEKLAEIINELKTQSNYLSEIASSNLFEKDIIFFTTAVNAREKDVLERIKEKISVLDVGFLEPGYLDVFAKFYLNEFFLYDTENENSFKEIIKQYREEAIYPIYVQHRAVIKPHGVQVEVDTTNLETFMCGISEKINYAAVVKDAVASFAEDIKDEMAESVVKGLITQSWGFTAFDASVKAIKAFGLALNEYRSPYSLEKVNSEYIKFSNSGESDLKSWFVNDLKTKLDISLSEANMEPIPFSPKVFDKYYDEFIKTYVVRYSLIYKVAQNKVALPTEHAEIFQTVWEAANDNQVRMNTDSF